MPHKKNEPGCPCCDDCDCIRWSDNYNRNTLHKYTQEAGSWSWAWSHVYTSDDDAILLLDRIVPTNCSISIDVTFASANDEVILYMAWEDNNNHLYGKVTYNGSSTFMEIHEVIDGVDTTLDSNYASNPGLTPTISLCYFDGRLSLVLDEPNETDAHVWGTVSDPDKLGQYVGCGTGTIDSTLYFRTFTLRNHTNRCPNCMHPFCLADSIPSSISVEFAGVVNGGCSVCDEWNNNTYVLDRLGSSGNYYQLTSGFPACFVAFTRMYLLFQCRTNLDGTTDVEIVLAIENDNPMNNQEAGSLTVVAEDQECCKTDCMEGLDGLEVTMTNGAGRVCDWSAAKATLTPNA